MNGHLAPEEILDQCAHGGSLLVQGGAGSGKTILTLSLLLELKRRGLKVCFISARLPTSALFRSSPLVEALGTDSLVDASMQSGNPSDPEIARMPLADLSDLAMVFLKTAQEKGVVALDPWDMLLQRDKRSDHEIYTAATDLINRTPGGLILTSENSADPNPLAHIVDAQVNLDREMYEGNIIRLLSVEKLRGQSIETPRYLFNLNDGVFTAFDPKAWNLRERPLKAGSVPLPIPEGDGHFSTGMTKLDHLLGGGYKRGSYVGIEIDPEAPLEACDLTFLPTASDFLCKKRPVVVVPPSARDASSLWDTARQIFDDEAWARVMSELIDPYGRVIPVQELPPELDSNEGRFLKAIKYWNDIKDALRKGANQPILSVIGYDSVARIYGEENVKPFVGSSLQTTRKNQELVIALVTSDLGLKRSILGIANYYFKLELVKGLPVFWGVKPRTGLYTISLQDDGGIPKTNLLKVS